MQEIKDMGNIEANTKQYLEMLDNIVMDNLKTAPEVKEIKYGLVINIVFLMHDITDLWRKFKSNNIYILYGPHDLSKMYKEYKQKQMA